MNSLINLGFSIEEMQMLMGTNVLLKNIGENQIQKHLSILEKYGCLEKDIINIITCNPFYFNNDSKEVENVLKYISKIVYPIKSLINTNPFILNKTLEEVKELDINELIWLWGDICECCY